MGVRALLRGKGVRRREPPVSDSAFVGWQVWFKTDWAGIVNGSRVGAQRRRA